MQQIIKLFENHNIETRVRDGRVLAREDWTKDGHSGWRWLDITEWTVEDANKWLGY